ncbi:hypothetical protein X975_10265, partial [Stegodyphus mimosarum]
MKQELSKRRYHSDVEVKAAAQQWLSDIGRDFFAEGIETFVPRLDKCLNNRVLLIMPNKYSRPDGAVARALHNSTTAPGFNPRGGQG